MDLSSLAKHIVGLPVAGRQQLANELVKKDAPRQTLAPEVRRQKAERLVAIQKNFEKRTAELQAEHEAHLALAQKEWEAAIRAYSGLTDCRNAYVDERDHLRAELRVARDPAIDALIAQMQELQAELPEILQGRTVQHPYRTWQNLGVDNRPSVDARRRAIEKAILVAEHQVTYEGLDGTALAARLKELRQSIPEAESADELLKRKLRDIRAQGPEAA